MYENRVGQQSCGKTEREESIALVIEKLADKLASMSSDTFQRANNKLQSVSRCSSPEACDSKPQITEPYPPLFESLRINLKTIERNLTGINDCLDRAEL